MIIIYCKIIQFFLLPLARKQRRPLIEVYLIRYQTILTSEPYETKDKCLVGIESLRINALDMNRYEFKKSFNLKHYFNVTDAHGEIIGSSEMYESNSGRDVGIWLVKVNAPIAVVEDLA